MTRSEDKSQQIFSQFYAQIELVLYNVLLAMLANVEMKIETSEDRNSIFSTY